MAKEFYFLTGSAGHTSSATYPGAPLSTFRQAIGSLGGTGSVNTPGLTNLQIVNGAVVSGLATMSWFSPPLQAFTLSGSVTGSVWGFEAAASNNATVGFRLWHKSGSLQGTGSETAMTAFFSSSTEWNGTTPASRAGSASLTTTVFRAGDRIVCRIYATGLPGAAVGGGSTTIYYGNSAAGVSGDSYLLFSQDIPIKKKIKSIR